MRGRSAMSNIGLRDYPDATPLLVHYRDSAYLVFLHPFFANSYRVIRFARHGNARHHILDLDGVGIFPIR
jgi:hypothetical protein